jgi:hypothetical protein
MGKRHIIKVSLGAADTSLIVKLLAKFTALVIKVDTIKTMHKQLMLRYERIQVTTRTLTGIYKFAYMPLETLFVLQIFSAYGARPALTLHWLKM